jgi:hypothetical protein
MINFSNSVPLIFPYWMYHARVFGSHSLHNHGLLLQSLFLSIKRELLADAARRQLIFVYSYAADLFEGVVKAAVEGEVVGEKKGE